MTYIKTMNNTNIVDCDEPKTTIEELISRLSRRLAESEGRVAFINNKLERKDYNYLGDIHAELAQAKKKTEITREVLDNVLRKLNT